MCVSLFLYLTIHLMFYCQTFLTTHASLHVQLSNIQNNVHHVSEQENTGTVSFLPVFAEPSHCYTRDQPMSMQPATLDPSLTPPPQRAGHRMPSSAQTFLQRWPAKTTRDFRCLQYSCTRCRAENISGEHTKSHYSIDQKITSEHTDHLYHLNKLKVCLFNAQSVRTKDKCAAINHFLCNEDSDVIFLMETWLRSHGDEAKLVDFAPPGYKMKSFHCASHVGGLAFLYRSSLHPFATITDSFSLQHRSFELAKLTHWVYLYSIYIYGHPPQLPQLPTTQQEKAILQHSVPWWVSWSPWFLQP